jgi:hypothetical protein
MRSTVTATVESLGLTAEKLSCHADDTVGGRSNTGQTSQTRSVFGEI